MDIHYLPNISDPQILAPVPSHTFHPVFPYVALTIGFVATLCWCIQDYRFFLSLGRGGRTFLPLGTSSCTNLRSQLSTIFADGLRYTSSLDPSLFLLEILHGPKTILKMELTKKFWHYQIERAPVQSSGESPLNDNSVSTQNQRREW